MTSEFINVYENVSTICATFLYALFYADTGAICTELFTVIAYKLRGSVVLCFAWIVWVLHNLL